MATQSEQAAERCAPFGGCTLLQRQYQTVGQQLIRFERGAGSYGYASLNAFKEFREGVSFIPVEVLESYLEDLLDLEVPLDRLALREGRFRFRLTYGATAVAGLLASLMAGLYVASIGASLLLSLALSMSFAFPFAAIWHFSPRVGAARRMALAQVVSHEISRRRGGDRDTAPDSSRFALSKLLRPNQQPLQGAAKRLWH